MQTEKPSVIKRILKIIGYTFLGILILGIVASLFDEKKGETATPPTTETAAPEVAAIAIDAPTLLSQYDANEVKADNMFKGKVLRITGRVGDIKKDIMDDVYVTLQDNDKYSIRSVQCFIEDAAVAANLTQGQQVTIEGKCDGLLMNVLVKDARVISY